MSCLREGVGIVLNGTRSVPVLLRECFAVAGRLLVVVAHTRCRMSITTGQDVPDAGFSRRRARLRVSTTEQLLY